MNNSFALRQSRCFATRVRTEAGSVPGAQATLCYRLAFGRDPTATEATRALGLVRAEGLDSLCWALFNASEFLYVK